MTPREVVLLGSTGSIGTQAIDVALANPDRLRIVGIGAQGSNPALLAEQALRLGVDVVAIHRAGAAQELQLAFYATADKNGYATGDFRVPKIIAGPTAMEELAAWPCDTVLNGITGSIGLAPTLSALRAGRTLALANKESLVAGGALVRAAAKPGQIVPVDSEHSALAQCLRAGRDAEVRRLVLTSSGGPFRGRRRDELTEVTLAEALAHPKWDMGPVISINSATMMNKALEIIETHELFGTPYDDIVVVVHPEHVIHSMVEFTDGASVAQASTPDMRLPIALALGWPDRIPGAVTPIDWSLAQTWRFEPPDDEAFPALNLAREAGRTGRCRPAILNAANEECVEAFTQGRLPFLGIVDTVAEVLSDTPGFDEPGTVDEVLAAEKWARDTARDRIARAAS